MRPHVDARLVMCVLVAGCASALHVTTDYDPAANFSQYKTYSWHDGTPAKDPLTDQKIVAAVDRQLAGKGLSKVDTNGNLTVTYHASTGQKVDLNTVYQNVGWNRYGWGDYGPYGNYWYGRRWGGGGPSVATTTTDTVTTGTVIVDLIDNKTKKLVWRGVGTDQLNGSPQQLQKAINAGAAKMFKDFPPPSSS